MHKSHNNAFLEVADFLNVWIGLREPNAFAERHIGRIFCGRLCHPKPMVCKAKTVTNANHPLKRLVANPYHEACTTAFGGGLVAARETWSKFETTPDFSSSFRVVDDGPAAGAVILNATCPHNAARCDCFIHSDYDLMVIVQADNNGKMISEGISPLSASKRGTGFTLPANRSNSGIMSRPIVATAAIHLRHRTADVIEQLNRRIGGLAMIQHGPEFEYMAGVGAAAKERVLWFGPRWQFSMGVSSMNKEMPH